MAVARRVRGSAKSVRKETAEHAQEASLAKGLDDTWTRWAGPDVFKGSERDLSEQRKTYSASRTGSAFLMSFDEGINFKCIRGPIGDGKSVLMCFYIVKKSHTQIALDVTEDGVKKRIRWSKWLIARHTFKALEETTIETWNQWFGDRTRWKKNPGLVGRYEEELADGTLCRIDFVCHALDSPRILNDLQSLELSGAWVNEATQTTLKIVGRIYSRLKRFNPIPGLSESPRPFHVIMDTNSPNETNWWYRMEVVKQPQGWMFFVCPPAVLQETDQKTGKLVYVPNDVEHARKHGCRPAENVREIDGGYHRGLSYWMDMISSLDDDDVRTLLMNKFGLTVAGMGVFAASWDNQLHRFAEDSEEAALENGMMDLLGMDLGRTPACAIGQMGTDGVLRIKRAVTTWNQRLNNGAGGLERMDVGQFWEERLKPVLVNEFGYPQRKHICFCDPAGKNFNEVVSVSAIERLCSLGLNAIPCDKVRAYSVDVRDITEGNNVEIRISCVDELLRRRRLKVSDAESCRMIVEGFNGKYCYRKMRATADGAERYDDKPDKNDWSHIMDAVQYLCLGATKGADDYTRPVAYGTFRMGFDAMNNPREMTSFQSGGIDFGCL